MADIQLARMTDVQGKADKTYVDTELAKKANIGHKHVVADITDFPSIPTKTSDLINDSGFITSNDIPEIPDVPTNVSELNNDAGYITNSYDNSTSGLTATTIQGAIDELKSLFDSLKSLFDSLNSEG